MHYDMRLYANYIWDTFKQYFEIKKVNGTRAQSHRHMKVYMRRRQRGGDVWLYSDAVRQAKEAYKIESK